MLDAQTAVICVVLSCLCLYTLALLLLGDTVFWAEIPEPLLWILSPVGTLWFGWLAIEEGHGTAERLGYSWGRKSKFPHPVLRSKAWIAWGLFHGIVCLIVAFVTGRISFLLI